MDDKRGAMMRRFLLMLMMLGLGAGAARADDNGLIYIGAGISRNKIDNITHTGTPVTDIDKTSWKVLAGVRPVKVFAVEADYLDLGNRTSTFINGVGSRVDAKAFAGYAVGFLPLPVPFLDLFGKAGVARWKLNESSAGTLPPSSFFALSDKGTNFAWGAGAQARIGNIGGRLEYEHFNIPNTSGAKVFSLSVVLDLF
jgi:Outer membrane protein beta-barrel domain